MKDMFKETKSLEKQGSKENKKEEQVIGGIIEDGDWQKSLPPGVTRDKVDTWTDRDGKQHWHLREDSIRDKDQRDKYAKEKSMWPWH